MLDRKDFRFLFFQASSEWSNTMQDAAILLMEDTRPLGVEDQAVLSRREVEYDLMWHEKDFHCWDPELDVEKVVGR